MTTPDKPNTNSCLQHDRLTEATHRLLASQRKSA